MTLPLNVAVFVKTPGLSPVKTRLAAGIGPECAATFYGLACAAVREVLEGCACELAPFQGHWAIAEPGAAAAWRDLPVLAQGEGSLGARLSVVYDAMLAKTRAGAAVLIGADAPRVTAETFAFARAALEDGSDFVIGPAADGGFYLFAGTRPLTSDLWESVPYSEATTTAELKRRLAPFGRVAMLGRLTDVDQAQDLAAASRELAALPRPTPTQLELMVWLDSLAGRC